ncbi:MAG: HEAT repeat domain-containing protein [Pyrinomonadaceae bacterium]
MPANSLRQFLVRWAPAALVVLLVISVISDLGGAWQSWQGAVKWVAEKLSPRVRQFFEGNETLVTVATFAVVVLLVAILAAVLQRVSTDTKGRGGGRGRASKRRGERAQTTRQWYLDYLREDVVNRRKASIHFARYIDIGLSESLHATMPLNFVAYDFFIYSTGKVKEYATFEEAFEDYRRRILLLGHPGSGKTTTLHNLALALIEEAERDPSAPLPLLLNLSKFSAVPEKGLLSRMSPFSRREELDGGGSRAFERWLVRMLNEMPVEGIRNVSRQWVEEGRVALLLDGLDEVNEAQVKALVRLMNETYLKEHSQQTVVVCSRIIEYQPLMEQKETRLALQGSATLKPLNREQINAYLEHAEATALRDALFDHEDLYEMAESPLTLSMMTLAYGGKAPLNVPRNQPFLERRRWLLDTYVARMVQRNARRLANVPFDLNPDNDVPTRYSLEQINHYLGWLAIKLSERMRTLLPLGRLHAFMSVEPNDIKVGFFTSANVATMIVGTLVSLLAIAALLYRPGVGFEGPPQFLALSLLAPSAFLLRLVMNGPDFPVAGKTSTTILSIAAAVVGIGGFTLLSFGLLNASFIRVMPVSIHPAVATAIAVPLIIAGMFILLGVDFDEIKKEVGDIVPTLFPCLALGVFVPLLAHMAEYIPLGLAASGVLFFFIYTRGQNANDRFPIFLLTFVCITAVLILLGWWATWLVGEPGAGTLSVAVPIAVGLILAGENAGGVAVFFAAALALAHLSGRLAPGVLASFGVAILGYRLLMEQSHRAVERSLLNPALKLVLLTGGHICPRYRAFLRHAADALLLKRAGAEYEFVHRLLRDHFAIRELIPALFGASGDEQLRIINQLSRQGDSGFDALSGLITYPDSRVRVAAVQGLGRIAIPKVLAVVRRILAEDTDAEVRAAALWSLQKFPPLELVDIYRLGAADVSPKVRASTLASLKMAYNVGEGLSEYRSMLRELVADGLEHESDEVFYEALAALHRLGLMQFFDDTIRRSMSRVRTALKASAPRARMVAAMLIGQSEDPEVMQDLFGALRDPEVVVRVAAAEGLANMRSSLAIRPLLTATSDPHESVRSASVNSIGAIAKLSLTPDEERSVKETLLKALTDNSAAVRTAAANALGHFAGEDVVVRLGRMLRDKSLEVKHAALSSLWKLKDGRAAGSLLEAAKDASLRGLAAEALANLDEPSVKTTLRSWLTRGDANQRVTAIMALTLSGDAEIVPTLKELLNQAPGRYAKTLFKFFVPGAIDLRPYAAVALGRLGGADVPAHLLNLSRHETKYTLSARALALTYFPRETVKALLQEREALASRRDQFAFDTIAREFYKIERPTGIRDRMSAPLRFALEGRGVFGSDGFFFAPGPE